MSQRSHTQPIVKVHRRMANLSLRLKLFIGLGTLIGGLLVVSAISALTGLATQQMVSHNLTQRRQLAELAANIDNTLLNVQNQAFEFSDTWSRTGFESGAGHGGFDVARETFLNPILEQLDDIREYVNQIERLETNPTTLTSLNTIRVSLDEYQRSLENTSDQMESLGFIKTGEFGQLDQIVTDIEGRLAPAGLPALEATLYKIDQHAQTSFLHNELQEARLVRESIKKLEEQIAAAPSAQLSPTAKTELNDALENYYDHFLAATSYHRRLQESRANLVGQSDLISTLIQELFEHQQVELGASIAQVQQRQNRSVTLTIVLAVLITAGGTLVAYFVSGQITQPVRILGQAAERLGAGELSVRVPIAGRDEIGAAATTFNLMADRLQELLSELEQRIADRTHDLETTTQDLAARSAELEEAHRQQLEINRQLEETVRQSQRRAELLQASAKVSRTVTQTRDLDRLLSQVTQLISRHFGFYHAGVFLIDEAGRYAVLRAANSEGGQRMLARHHKLGVGSEGMVGYVTGTGNPRIALDVGEDAVFFDNPDLPHTRSEAAVPLHVGDEIIGALDVQSTAEMAFTEEDIVVLTALADQVATAIENAYLFQQSRTALEEAEQLERRFVQQEWSQFTRDQPALVYEYTLSGVSPVGDAPLPELEEAQRKGQLVIVRGDQDGHDGAPARAALAVPIKFRDQVVGVLDLQETETDRVWTDEEIALIQAIADQIGQALESARLFEETQRRARREALTRQITERVRAAGAAGDIEAILQTTAEELGEALGVTRAVARLTTPPDERGDGAPDDNGKG